MKRGWGADTVYWPHTLQALLHYALRQSLASQYAISAQWRDGASVLDKPIYKTT